ncbi:snRNA-activating protein complex subunit 4 isoform X3 [Narcine bancroftii]|uniref:snRNA-activating protein complex subunit 4 isoform X3 n=1 Tax=Narcine bancroftii TaxID=1343680 RepID=UPI003831057C
MFIIPSASHLVTCMKWKELHQDFVSTNNISGYDEDDDEEKECMALVEDSVREAAPRLPDSISDDEGDDLPEDPETCLQMNLVYQEVIVEKLQDLELLLTHNKEQQAEIMSDLAGQGVEKSKSAKSQSFLFLGHFMKPYFRDKVTGLGPPANEDTKEKATQGIKSFEEFLVPSWKQREKDKLKVSVANDSTQRLLQPKLLRLEFLNKKLEMSRNEKDKNFFRKQIGEIEREMEAINQMTQRQLLGNRFDDHDWIKIANIDFDGSRSAEDIKRAWQNHEHPSINRAQWSSQETQQLIEIAERVGCVDWEWIASELKTNRTAYMCLQKYQELNKDLKKRAWSRKEDQMLTELVQKMRVGNFIPYTKIAYFMEGRNGSQLLHRWSKTLDPSVKKGPWSPAEDALLLKAVAKYGKRDWFKIQEEVPGRVDSQCRERYMYCLNHNIRKGKWTPEEESDLKALIEKHGVGKWSKVASELTGRTDTQCSSKWKTLEGIKPKPLQGTRKRKRRRHLTRSRRWESSSEESFEDWEDEDEKILEEMEQEQEEEEAELEKDEDQKEDLKIERKKRRIKHKKATDPIVLDVDQWVPVVETKQPPAETNSQVVKTVMEHPVDSCKIESQNPRGRPKSSKIWSTFLKSSNAIPSVGEVGVGPAERVLSAPTIVPDSTPPLKTVECLVANVQQEPLQSQKNPKRARRRILAAHLSDRNLDRRLLAEISRWTTARPVVRREIDVMRERMEAIGLSSTPIFVLLLQVFRIDKEGCMQIIKEEMNKDAQSLSAISKNGDKSSLNPYLNQIKGTTIDVGNGQTMEMTRFKLSSAPFREKPKTVQELLAEKRRTGGIAQRPLIIPQPLITQQPLQVTMMSKPAALSKVPVGPEPQVPEQSRSSSPIQTRVSMRRRKPVIESTVGQVGLEKPTLTGKPKGNDESKMTSTPHNSQLHSSAIVKPMKNDKLAPALDIASVQPAAASRKGRGRRLQPIAPAPSVQPVLQPNSLMIPIMLPNSTVPIMALVTPQGLLCIPPGTGLPNQNAHGLAAATIASQNNNTAVTTMPLGIVSTSMSSSTPTQAAINFPLACSQSDIGGPNVAPVLTTSSTKLSSTHPVNVSSLAVCKLIPPSSNSAQIQPTQTPANCGTLAPTLTSANAATPCADLTAVKFILQVAANHVDSTVNAPPTIQLAQDSGSSGKTVDTPNTESSCAWPSSLAQPEGTKLPTAKLHSDKTSTDFKLLSDNKDAVMKDWLEGEGGVHVPGTQTSLPYLPPFASTLRGFSNLLLHKKVLEHNLPDFETTNVNEPVDHKKRLESARVLVSKNLKYNPAYQLLKARFLSAFTLPAFLATLPPQGTLTTIGSLNEDLNQDSTEESEYTETDMDSDKELPQQCITDEVTSKELNQPFEIPDDLSFDCDLLGGLETVVGDQSTPEASSALEGESRVATRQSQRLRKIP